MFPSSTLTRSQFERACHALILKYQSYDSASLTSRRLTGWSWVEHATYPRLGFMSRTVLCPRMDLPADDLDDGEEFENQETLDVVAAPTAVSDAVIATQSVVFSATFRVPVFYFAIHDTQGSPLPLAEIVKTPLFHRRPSPADMTPFSIGHPGSLFPLLSQGDHPTLGTPSWYIHPCETPSAMAELAAEIIADTEPEVALWTEAEQLIRWMEAWFMLLGNVVDLDNP